MKLSKASPQDRSRIEQYVAISRKDASVGTMSIVVKYFRQRLHLCEADHLVVFHQVEAKKRAKPVYFVRAEPFTSVDEKWPVARDSEVSARKFLFSFPWRCRPHCASIALYRTHMLRCVVAQFVHCAAGWRACIALNRIFYPENTYSCECVLKYDVYNFVAYWENHFSYRKWW